MPEFNASDIVASRNAAGLPHPQGDGASARISVKTETGFVFPMKQSLREATGVNVGDTVIVTIEQNLELRPTPSDDVATALATYPTAQSAWDRLSPSHQRKHLDHINEAKQADTRARRIGKMLEILEG